MINKIKQVLIECKKKSMTISYLKESLGISKDKLSVFTDSIDLLKKNGEIVDYNDRIYLVNHSKMVKGKMEIKDKGYGFLLAEDGNEDVYIPINGINGAYKDDICIVMVEAKGYKKREGFVVEILKRGHENVIGTFKTIKKINYVIPDKNLDFKIVVPKKYTMGAMEDHKVKAKIREYVDSKLVIAEITDIFGHVNDPGIDILSVVFEHDIPIGFDKEIINEVSNIPDYVLDYEYDGRIDLRNEKIVTIDGDDTKDIDDAVGLTKLDNGNYRLLVSIADVSYYVKKGSLVDTEAYLRGTSVYLVDRVIPMLPHRLSNGICSLNPGEDRLSITCEMEIDTNGFVVKNNIYPSVIRSLRQMTYKNVNKILAGDLDKINEYAMLVDMFKLMNELSEILYKKRHARGSIDFETTESKIICDENGKAIDIYIYERGKSEQIIEEFMLIANETVAKKMSKYPFIYRIHENPDYDKLEKILAIIKNMGYVIEGDHKKITVKVLQKFLESIKGLDVERAINTMLLRSMAKAKYSEECLGHFGLGTKYYTHFTSPIRRYPDLIVHRLIRDFLFMKNNNYEYWEKNLPKLATHTSAREKEAADCERDVESMKKAEYMTNYIGNIYEGMISSVTPFGMFVELENSVEGLIHVSNLPDYFDYDEINMCLIGRVKKKIYRIGDKICIKVMQTNKTMGQIDFLLAGDIK